MSKLLLLSLVLALGSCTTWRHSAPHSAAAPPRARQYYHPQQRKNEQQRRRLVKPNITWN